MALFPFFVNVDDLEDGSTSRTTSASAALAELSVCRGDGKGPTDPGQTCYLEAKPVRANERLCRSLSGPRISTYRHTDTRACPRCAILAFLGTFNSLPQGQPSPNCRRERGPSRAASQEASAPPALSSPHARRRPPASSPCPPTCARNCTLPRRRHVTWLRAGNRPVRHRSVA